MKTILVTGGAGFIGSNLVHYLYNKYPDYKILVLDALTYAGSVDNLPKDFCGKNSERGEFHYGSIMNHDIVNSLISQVDTVIHLAAETHVSRSIADNKDFFYTDVIGTQIIANSVQKHKNVERFIHISTSEVYGTAVDETMNEGHPLNPCSPYAAAKVGADRLVYSYWYTYGIPCIIIRPFNNYGPRQHLEKVVPRFITSILLGEELRIHGDGSAKRDYVHVEDTCRAIDLIMHASLEKVKGQIFNVGSGVDISIKEIAEHIIGTMGRGSYVNIGDRPGQVFRHTSNITKIEKILGWSPQLSWVNGVIKTIDWYEKNRNFWEKQLWMREIPIINDRGEKELH